MSLMWPEWQMLSSIFNSVHFSRNFIFRRLFCFLIILNFILRISFLLKNTSIYTSFTRACKQNGIHLNNSKWRMVPFPLLVINDVIMTYWIGVRSVAWEFEGIRTGRKVRAPKAAQTRGSGSMFPQKIFEVRVSEIPSPAFSTGHF